MKQDSEIAWAPLPGFQVRACAAGAFEVLMGGAAGPGKTSILVAKALQAAQHKNGKALFLRSSFKDTLDVRDRMYELYPKLGGVFTASESRWTFPGGGTVQLGYAKTMPEVMDYLGTEWTDVSYDELTLLPEERVWQMLLGRIRSTDPTVPLRARASANPIGPGRAWVMERFVVPCGADGSKVYRDEVTGRTRMYVPGTALDNPLLPQSYWDGLRDLPPLVQKALRDGDWAASLGVFYPELADRERHLVKGAPPVKDWHTVWGGYDWGFSHQAVFQWYARVGDTIYVLDTLYMHRFQDEEQAATIAGAVPERFRETVYAGHDAFARRMAHSAAAESVADVFRRYNIYLTKANVDRMAGAKVLRRLFRPEKAGEAGEQKVRVKFVDTDGNRQCLKELAALVPDDKNVNVPAKRDADETGKNGDDAADTTRYGIATPMIEGAQPPDVWRPANVSDGTLPLPWEVPKQGFRLDDGTFDKRTYAVRPGRDDIDNQFDDGWGNM